MPTEISTAIDAVATGTFTVLTDFVTDYWAYIVGTILFLAIAGVLMRALRLRKG